MGANSVISKDLADPFQKPDSKPALVRNLKRLSLLMLDWNVRRSTGYQPGNLLRHLFTRGVSPKPTCWSTRRSQTTSTWWSDEDGFLKRELMLLDVHNLGSCGKGDSWMVSLLFCVGCKLLCLLIVLKISWLIPPDSGGLDRFYFLILKTLLCFIFNENRAEERSLLLV
jgi:hypothetical protein